MVARFEQIITELSHLQELEDIFAGARGESVGVTTDDVYEGEKLHYDCRLDTSTPQATLTLTLQTEGSEPRVLNRVDAVFDSNGHLAYCTRYDALTGETSSMGYEEFDEAMEILRSKGSSGSSGEEEDRTNEVHEAFTALFDELDPEDLRATISTLGAPNEEVKARGRVALLNHLLHGLDATEIGSDADDSIQWSAEIKKSEAGYTITYSAGGSTPQEYQLSQSGAVVSDPDASLNNVIYELAVHAQLLIQRRPLRVTRG